MVSASANSFQADQYSEWDALFETNTRLKIGSFYGWTAGRCVSATHPNNPTPSILVSWQDSSGVLRAFVMFHKVGDLPPEHYDVLTSELKTQMEEMISKWESQIPPILDQKTEWTGTHSNGARVALRGHPSQDSILAIGGTTTSPKNRICSYSIPLYRP